MITEHRYSKKQLHHAEVSVSEILESYGIPDPYIWRINQNGKLIPENSDDPIENIIIRTNRIGNIEYKAFQEIQKRTRAMDIGDYVLWISPIHPLYYPDASKIVITRKLEDGTLLNRAVVTDWDAVGSIIVAREFATLARLNPHMFKNTDDVRRNPIFIDKENDEIIGLALKKMLDANSIEMMANGEDFKLKEKHMNDVLEGKQVELGQNPRSCPTEMENSAFNVFAGRDEYGPLQFECPHCHKVNTRGRGKLISNCQHCNKNVKC